MYPNIRTKVVLLGPHIYTTRSNVETKEVEDLA